MAIIRVDDPADDRLAAYRNVSDRELLVQDGLFVAEGRLVVRRLLEGRRFPVRSVMVNDAALVPLRRLLDAHEDLPVYLVPQVVMDGITGFNMHRGCLALGERPRPCHWRDVVNGARRVIALERIGNADNVGSVFRSASAFGIDAVLLEQNCIDPFYRKAIRTSMGAALTMPYAQAEPWPEVLRELGSGGNVGPVLSASARVGSRQRPDETALTGGSLERTAPADRRSSPQASEGWAGQPWVVMAMTPSSDAPDLRQLAPTISNQPIVIVVGNEGEGLSDAALDACTHRARIPMMNNVDSLNVATAAAIALYELTR